MSQVINHHVTIDQVEGMGSITRAYTERVLELGTHTYSETTTMAFLDGHTTVYVFDLLQLRNGVWSTASVCDDSRTGEHSEEYGTVDQQWAERWSGNRRAEHGMDVAA